MKNVLFDIYFWGKKDSITSNYKNYYIIFSSKNAIHTNILCIRETTKLPTSIFSRCLILSPKILKLQIVSLVRTASCLHRWTTILLFLGIFAMLKIKTRLLLPYLGFVNKAQWWGTSFDLIIPEIGRMLEFGGMHHSIDKVVKLELKSVPC